MRTFRPPPISNRVPGAMNRLEQSYADYLELLKKAQLIVDWRYEVMKLRLAHKTFYTPDFLVIRKDCMEFHETKGFMRDDAAVKLKVAAQTFPWFRFLLVKKEGPGWNISEIKVP